MGPSIWVVMKWNLSCFEVILVNSLFVFPWTCYNFLAWVEKITFSYRLAVNELLFKTGLVIFWSWMCLVRKKVWSSAYLIKVSGNCCKIEPVCWNLIFIVVMGQNVVSTVEIKLPLIHSTRFFYFYHLKTEIWILYR